MPEGVQREITASRDGEEREDGRAVVMRRRVGKGVEGERVEGGEVVRVRV